ncbi:hypothetical protein NW762_013667 [Fusarium torreyae]|uniref:Uncharacterized protein n=1 Tax=Fusarium torreyae TaxID=1237075 RepID=A0A9W8RLP6_9HYPO|nr:hypothetical protein NW762_013667 [Fusarium torreyae]
MDASHGHGEDDIGSKHEAEHERNNLIPFPALLNDFFNWMTNVTDLHIHEGYHISKIPDFSQALRSMPNLTALKMTGHIDYLQIFDQIITLEQGAALQTLDISDVTTGSWDYHDSDRQKVIQKLQEHTGTAPFTRLLAGPTLDVEVLMALVAWPKCLERFALHVDSSRIARHLVYDGSLQPALDIQKHSLTHLRIEGDYELGLSGFDLRDFPCLEHLCLCNATMSNFNQHPRNKTVVPDLDARIFAPRLRNLLWRLPWWLTGKDKMRDFFSRKHEKRLRSLLDMALKLKEERSDGEWQFEGIWVQSVLEVPDPLRVKRRRNFDKEMDRLRALGDEFRPLGIDIRHVPVPELKDNSMYIEDSVFEPLDRVWRWDDNFKFL